MFMCLLYSCQETKSNKRCHPSNKNPQEDLISRPNTISVIFSMDVPLVRKTSVSVFYEESLAGCFLKIFQVVTKSLKIKK